MIKHKDRILIFLSVTSKCWCDDCLSEILDIKPRQSINAICNGLNNANVINREKSQCFFCKRTKLSNYITEGAMIRDTMLKSCRYFY